MAFKALEDLIAALTRRVQRAELRVTMAAPAGVVQPYAGVTLPDGWLWADGGTYDPDVYPALYAAIGTTYGGTPEAPLLPNLTGRVPVGLDAGDADLDTAGNAGGEKEHTLTEAEMPRHRHPWRNSGGGPNASNLDQMDFSKNTPGRTTEYDSISVGGLDQINIGTRFTGGTSPIQTNDAFLVRLHVAEETGGGEAHNNMPPYIALPYLIKT